MKLKSKDPKAKKTEPKPSENESKSSTKQSENPEIPEKRKYLKTILLGVGGAIILLVIIALIIFMILSKEEPARFSEVCETKECVKLGGEMREIMNNATDPCQDFYEYSCGNWKEFADHPIKNRKKLETFFQKTYKPVTRSERIAKVVFEKCLLAKSAKLGDLNQRIWHSQDFTELLIEVVKVTPIDTFFLRNSIRPEYKEKKLVLTFYAHLAEYKEFWSATEKFANNDLNATDLSPDDTTTFTFIDLQRYLKGLLPEEYREKKMNWKLKVARTGIEQLNTFLRNRGVSKIRDNILRPRWEKELESC
ncbi:unnamed protein product [Caenorhabditis angaria]|uniref:Peptidase M13 N-terminal domain-containing protein n=1 Tax=Caenorhabditis angaria TaxID=860376 RepID=A0A9P1MZ71_9PELO|nr:unnamed protein product [Caenorhabditis angaria]